jgi:hypothetical protein
MVHTYSNCSLKVFTEIINSDFNDNDRIISITLQSIKSHKITHLENILIGDFKIKICRVRTNFYKVRSAVIEVEEAAESIDSSHKGGGRLIKIPQKTRSLALRKRPNPGRRFRD